MAQVKDFAGVHGDVGTVYWYVAFMLLYFCVCWWGCHTMMDKSFGILVTLSGGWKKERRQYEDLVEDLVEGMVENYRENTNTSRSLTSSTL